MLRSKRGLSTIEYAVVLVAFASALMMMKEYISRGLQGHMRGMATVLAGEQNYLGQDKMLYSQKEEKDALSKKDLSFGAGKILGNDFAYAKGKTMGLQQQETMTMEKTIAENGIITVENQTRKQRIKQELVFPEE